MNNYRSIIWRFFTVFFFIFGLLQTLFFARAIFPQFRASGLNTPQTLLCMVSAIILSALYSMICVDGQESLYAIKSRLIICGIPCVLICSVLSVNYGLPSLILDLLGIADRGTGISIWLIAVILSLNGTIVELAKNTIAHFLSTKPGKKQYLPNKVRSEVSMDILLYFGGPALIAFLIQFLVGCRTQHKILRYIPIYCFVITLAFAIIALTSDSGFFLGGNVIAALAWCIIGVCFLIGYALAIFIYKHRK